MKTNKLLIGVVLLLGACSQDRMDIPQMPESAEPVSVNMKAIENYLSKTRRGLTRGDNYTLTPYIVEGDTVMYIANYGEGWEVFSNDTRVPMVLMKSETGSFYPNAMTNETPFENLFQNTAAYLHELNNESPLPTDTINGEWKAFIPKTLSADDINVEPSDDDQYHWEYIGSSVPEEHHTEYTPLGGRLKTKWAQSGLYKTFTPYENGQHTPLGCTAVAIGQYLYYTHYRNNQPAQTVTTAVYNVPSNSYNFSGSSSTVWDSFKKYVSYLDTEESMMPTAIFLGWIAKSIETKFSLDGSGANFDKSNVLNFFNSQTGLNAKIVKNPTGQINSLLKKGYPVIMGAFADTEKGTTGHTWIVDYNKADYTTYNDFYIYVKRSEDDGGNPYDEPDLDVDFFNYATIKDIQELFGNYPVDVVPNSYGESYYKCNWGWGGYQDDVECHSSIVWAAGGYKYYKDQVLYYF